MSLWLVLGLVGCGTIEYPPPSSEIRSQLSAVGVVDLPPERPWPAPDRPARGKTRGALVGAGMGAVFSIALGTTACAYGASPDACGYGILVGAALAPVAAVVGGVLGARNAHPAAQVLAADANLRAALDAASPAETLGERLVAVARQRRLPVRLRRIGAEEAGQDHAPAGLDALAEVRVERFGLHNAGSIDPDTWLELEVLARLVRATNHRELYWRKWRYRGGRRNYFDMAADDAAKLRAEIEKGISRTADKMIDDLFVSDVSEKKTDRQGEGVWTIDASNKRRIR